MSAIPTKSRLLVAARDRGQCQRCGISGADWHHRRSRRVGGPHQHCPCNGVHLCRTCHSWVHKHPTQAQETGLIVSAYVDEPGSVAYRTFGDWWVQATCEGDLLPSPHPREAVR